MLYLKEQATHEAFVERTKARAKALGLSIPQLAQAAEIKEVTLKNMLYKKVEIGRGALITLASALDCSVEFLATGVSTGNDGETISIIVQTPEDLARSLSLIPNQKSQASPELEISNLPLPVSIVKRFGVLPENIRAVMTNNESLSPTLSRGDTLLVDIGTTRLCEGIFIIAVRDSVVVRFASPVAKGFTLASSSPHVYGTTVSVNEETGDINEPHIKIIGRAVGAVILKGL